MTTSYQEFTDSISPTGTNARWGTVVIENSSTNGHKHYIDSLRVVPDTENSAVDLAETFYKIPLEKLEPGDILITTESNGIKVTKSSMNAQMKILGIYSTKPGITLDDGDGKKDQKVPVALQGRVPVKVSSLNGKILSGDPITSSSLKGIGMKSLKPGSIVAKALETFAPNDNICSPANSLEEINWPEDDGTNPAKPCFKLPDGTYVGKIMAFVNVSWYDPDVYLTSTGDITLDKNLASSTPSAPVYDVFNAGVKVDRVGVFSEAVVGSLKFGSLNGDNVNIDSLKLNGVDIDGTRLNSGLNDIDNLNILVASNSASLASNTQAIASNSASLSRVNDQVTSLDENINNLASQLTTLSTQVSNLLALDSISSASISGLLVNSSTDLTNAVSIDQPILFLDSALFGNDLYAYADTYLKDTYVDGGITITGSNSGVNGSSGNGGSGIDTTNLHISSSEIYSDSILKIQATGLHGLDLMAGKVTLDEYGNMNIKGDLHVEGDTNIDNNLNVSGSLEATGSAVLGETTVNTLTASSSAVLGDTATETLTLGTNAAGVITMPIATTEMQINFTKAYKTQPIVTVTAQDLFVPVVVSDITTTGFKIKIQNPSNTPIKFNWIAVGTK